jgi:hypothetical protein
MLGNEKVHHIRDADEFYKALGYNDEIRKTGLMPEEYIWEKYHKAKSVKSAVCMEARIIEYLNKNSSTFKNNYAVECEHWLESCKDQWTNNSSQCAGCFIGNR